MSVRDRLLPHLTVGDEGAALSAGAVLVGELGLGGVRAVAVLFDFSVSGGSCGEDETDAVIAAIRLAAGRRLSLVTVLASGGTRLTEGMHALVGIPRMALALQELRAARLPHVCVADQPATGGVWVALGCAADLRAGVAGATVAFSGPRVVEAMTGRAPAPGTGTAEGAHAAGLLDAVVAEPDAVAWIARALAAVAPAPAGDAFAADECDAAATAAAGPDGEVAGPARGASAASGRGRLAGLLGDGAVTLAGGDGTVAAAVGRFDGRTTVGTALAAAPGAIVGAAGFRLLARAARLADTLAAPLVTYVDTLGGDPHDPAVPTEILAATLAVLECRSPTVAVVHGAGGSGGALAGAVADTVLVGPDGWFAALAPVGAAAALRRSVEEATQLMRPAPADLLASGLADAAYGAGTGEEREAVGQALRRLATATATATADADADAEERLARRRARWSSRLSPLR